MAHSGWLTAGLIGVTAFVSGCGGIGSGDSGLFRKKPANADSQSNGLAPRNRAEDDGVSLFSLFGTKDDPNITVEVNKYIWNATLEILNFLPIQTVDPFTGVIVTGYGTPPGGSQAWRATVLIQDPALDARSLNLALMTRSGPASAETVRMVEDAILTRARQLRLSDGGL